MSEQPTGAAYADVRQAPAVLELRGVSKVYGAEPPVYALREVSFAVARGRARGDRGPLGLG